MRTRVKICGLTRLEDALLAARLGADALGFVFAAGKRQVDPGTVATFGRALPPWVNKVGVFGAEAPERIAQVATACRLDTVQLHGEPDPDALAMLRERFAVVQVIPVGPGRGQDLSSALAGWLDVVDGILLDTAHGGTTGGTGRTFDWSVLSGLLSPVPVMVAGGLSPENVGSLLAVARPWGVDVSSGVERAPGVKDPQRLAAFFEAVGRATPKSAPGAP